MYITQHLIPLGHLSQSGVTSYLHTCPINLVHSMLTSLYTVSKLVKRISLLQRQGTNHC